MLPEAVVIQEPVEESKTEAGKAKKDELLKEVWLVCQYFGIITGAAGIKGGIHVLNWLTRGLENGRYEMRRRCFALMRKIGLKEIKVERAGDPDWPCIHVIFISSNTDGKPEEKRIFVGDRLHRRLIRSGNGYGALWAILNSGILKNEIKNGNQVIFGEQVYTVSIKPKEYIPWSVDISVEPFIN